MINNNLNLQHSFLPGKSCQSNLFSMLEKLADWTGYYFKVDFSKTRSLVTYIKLIPKLKLGISHRLCHPRERFWFHFIYITYKQLIKRYIRKIISFFKQHKTFSVIYFSSPLPRDLKWHRSSNWMAIKT